MSNIDNLYIDIINNFEKIKSFKYTPEDISYSINSGLIVSKEKIELNNKDEIIDKFIDFFNNIKIFIDMFEYNNNLELLNIYNYLTIEHISINFKSKYIIIIVNSNKLDDNLLKKLLNDLTEELISEDIISEYNINWVISNESKK